VLKIWRKDAKEMKRIITLFIAFLSVTGFASEPKRFDIPDGSFYVCKNKRAEDMLIQLMYSRTSNELASVIVYAPTQRIDKLLTWLYFASNKSSGESVFNYRNTNVSSTVLTILPKKSSVLISGDGSILEFINCIMIRK
jgi:hypothetical protein